MSQSQSLLCGYGWGKLGDRINPEEPVRLPPHGAGKTQRTHISSIWALVTHEENLLLKHAAWTSVQANQEPREWVLEWTCRDRDIEKMLSSSEEPGHVKRSYLIYENENYSKRERLFRIWKDKMKTLYPDFPTPKMKYLLKGRDNLHLVIWYSLIWAHFHVTEMIRNLNGVGSLSLHTTLENGLIKTA